MSFLRIYDTISLLQSKICLGVYYVYFTILIGRLSSS